MKYKPLMNKIERKKKMAKSSLFKIKKYKK